MKTFVWSCAFNGLEAEGIGRSKKEAKAAAAKFLKEQLDLDSLPQPGEKKRKSPATNQKGPQPFSKKKKTDFPPRHFFPGQFPADQPDGCFADNANEEGGVGGLPPCPPMNYGPGPIFYSRLSKLDRNVIRKHKEIYPGEAELAIILELVGDTEEAMKLVAEEIGKEVNEEPGQDTSNRLKQHFQARCKLSVSSEVHKQYSLARQFRMFTYFVRGSIQFDWIGLSKKVCYYLYEVTLF